MEMYAGHIARVTFVCADQQRQTDGHQTTALCFLLVMTNVITTKMILKMSRFTILTYLI